MLKTHFGLFEGIGGFSLAAQMVGWKTIGWVEKNEFCQKVLRKNFKTAKGYGDIKEFNGLPYRGQIGIVTGGFPCQPFSVAGKRGGESDDRFLWPQMLRVICEIQPPFVVGENVPGILSLDDGKIFQRICLDLEKKGYAVQAFNIPACAVQAPHRRQRIWIIAYHEEWFNRQHHRKQKKGQKPQFGKNIGDQSFANPDNILHERELVTRGNKKKTRGSKTGNHKKRETPFGQRVRNESIHSNKITTNSNSKRPPRQRKYRGQLYSKQNKEGQIHRVEHANQFQKEWPQVAAQFCRVDDGVSPRLDKNRNKRLEALGNAIVPQVAYEIFKAIDQYK